MEFSRSIAAFDSRTFHYYMPEAMNGIFDSRVENCAIVFISDPNLKHIVIDELKKISREENVRCQLNALYSCSIFRSIFDADELYSTNNELMRGFAIDRLRGCDQDRVTDAYKHWYCTSGCSETLIRAAKEDSSAFIRLKLCSSLQTFPDFLRADLAYALSQRVEDANDPTISAMLWYGIIPLIEAKPQRLSTLAADSKIPLIRKWTARRFAEIIAEKPNCLNDLLAKTAGKDESVRRDVIQGITEGLAGIRKASLPAAWAAYPKTFADAKLTDAVRAIDVVFGSGRALDEVRKLAFDGAATLEQRKAAVRSLIDADPADLRQVCEKLLKTRFVNTVALKGLGKFDDTGPAIVKAWNSFHPSERPLVVDALIARPGFAAVLLDAIGKGTIPRTDLSAAQARTILGYGKPDLTAKLAAVWGEIRTSPKDKADFIAKLKGELTPDVLSNADKSAGRAVFAKTCASCHKLYGSGESVGPDLTGAGRKDMDYLLGNIVDPSAVVTKDFMVTKFVMKDGRTLNGIVKATAPKTITVQMEKELITVAKDDIENQTQSLLSLMPDGLLQTLTPQQVKDLFAYLQSDSQVELK